jgi:DNA-binding NarL/FixJ family response regulator
LANPAGLTTRQTEVLRLLDDGLTNAELAERLYLSVKTVDHHVSAILTKLDVTKRRDAVRRARELNLLN